MLEPIKQYSCQRQANPVLYSSRKIRKLPMPMSQTTIDRARFNMIEQQVRTWDVLDQRVLDIMSAIPREAFVPERYAALAFADTNVPLGHGQVMMAPKLEGRLLQALDIKSGDTVLEVGTGSGYVTACLARLGKQVTSIDIIPEFTRATEAKLAKLNCHNVNLETGDALGDAKTGPSYDVIAVTGSLPELHREFHQQLKTGGRLFVITGTPPIMEALLITRIGADNWARESLFETSIPPLLHATEAQVFDF